jgi:CheY-like chemotaxis protein
MTDQDRFPPGERRDPAQAATRRRLEELVALRTAELAVAKDAAEAALAAKSAFLARMSHEIRTPMNTIIGLNHIMLRDMADPQLRRQIAKVLGAAEQLRGLIDGMGRLVASQLVAKGLALEVEAAADLPRLLLVDDNELNLEVAAALLKILGYEVDLARDGIEAIERAQQCSYAAILLDVQMPRMDGLEATRHLRQTARHASTPIIAMTASVFEEDRQSCLAAGMNDLVAKPVDPRLLASVLRRWVPRTTSALSGPGVATAAVVGAPVEQLQARARLLELQRLVAADDFDAREYFHSLPLADAGRLGSELGRAIDDFNYARAETLISNLLDEPDATAGGR